jgi:hypothetical protein
MTRLTGQIVSYSTKHANGKVRIIGTEIVIVFHADEFKSKIQGKIYPGTKISFNVRKSLVAPGDPVRPNIIKAVNCVVEFEDDEFLNVEEISGLFPASPESKSDAG